MAITVEVQFAYPAPARPDRRHIVRCVRAALAGRRGNAELTVRVVDEAEGAELNRRWRGGRGATNVLSFPAADLGEAAPAFLGDLVICAPVVEREAQEQGKTLEAHWAHVVVHGTLHLMGHDHRNDSEASAMESLETAVLGALGFPDPYER